jgi:hypothetical protein
VLAIFLLLIHPTAGLFAGQSARFFKAECGTSANFIKLTANGKYLVISRDDFGVSVDDQGTWDQTKDIITFNSTDAQDGPYQGIEVRYKDRVFIAWKAGSSAGLAMPVQNTERELDRDPEAVPPYVYFEIDENAFKHGTKKSNSIHYLKAK